MADTVLDALAGTSGLRGRLEEAEGESQHVLVVFVDVRGFSAFSRQHESPDVASFVKRLYIRLLDDYFPFAEFAKTTGDGMLIIIPFNAGNLRAQAQRTIEACLRCDEEFSSIAAGDPMVNFSVPSAVGIGVGRGTACRLVAMGETIDYSGHTLNLTARLMDLARPHGVVVNGDFGLDTLPKEVTDRFGDDEVVVRNIGSDSLTPIKILRDAVEIPASARLPAEDSWSPLPFDALKKRNEWDRITFNSFRIDLPGPPRRPDAFRVSLSVPAYRGGRLVRDIQTTFYLTPGTEFTYSEEGGTHILRLHVGPIRMRMDALKVKRTSRTIINVRWVPA